MFNKLCGTMALLGVLTATPAPAQLPGLEIEPYLGVFIPATSLVDQQLPGVPEDVLASQKEALALGARLTVWLLGPIGLEGNFMYAFSDQESEVGGVTTSENAYAWAAAARLILRFGVPLAPISFHLNGGIATIGRGGDAYKDIDLDGLIVDVENTNDIGGVLGAGLRVKLPALFAIRADAESYVYSAKFKLSGGGVSEELESQLQADIVVSAGLVIPIGL